MPELREHFLIPESPLPDLSAYRAATGADAVAKARATAPDAVLAEIRASGLRGRGGAGFPTGTKWASIAGHPCRKRYVVCNAAEGEPGTFKDRWLLRHNPYAVIEGMLIAAHVVGAFELTIAIKASFAPELARLRAAVDELAGALGDRTIQIVEGPEEYLFGEEKALLEVVEGNEPLPREAHYPPYERGLHATAASPNPALVNNAETFARVPGIVRSGAASFRALGTPDTPGPIIYTVSGDVRRPGLYEREAGVSLRALLYDAAGGPRNGRAIAAVLSGVSAAVITPDRFDTPADFGSLHLIGGGLGSAGFIAYDDSRSMPRLAQSVARFLYVESCNQCSACKAGLRTASEAIDELFDPATATTDDYPRALYGARSAPQGNRCYLPVQGSVLIPSLMTTFEAAFADQLRHPDRPTEPIAIAKLVDYDPATHTFTLDADQERKSPDWTYEEPRPTVRPAHPAPAPRDADRAPIAVRLRPDLAAQLTARADAEGVALDRLVDRLLRASLTRRAID